MRTTEPTAKPSPVPREAQADGDAGTEPETMEQQSQEGLATLGSETSTGWGSSRRIITAVLVILVVVSTAGTWYLASGSPVADIRPATSKDGSYTPGSLPSEGGAAAVRAASDLVPIALSYDYRNLDKSLRRATERMSPSFAKTFRATFTSAVEPMATKNKAVTKALVRGAGLTELGEDDSTATCVLFVDQVLVTSEGSGKAQPHIGKERVLVDLVDIDGTWLVDDIRPL